MCNSYNGFTNYFTWVTYTHLTSNHEIYSYAYQKLTSPIFNSEDNRKRDPLTIMILRVESILEEFRLTSLREDRGGLSFDLLSFAYKEIDYEQVARKLLENTEVRKGANHDE